jgi:DNA-binding LacI/PurR family transcriptional regulator
LCNRLYFLIFVWMNGKKRHITIHDIAHELGISASTVSRALNNNPRISTATRDLVQKLAKSQGYQPNVMASSLRKGQGNTVGVIVPNINRSFFSNIIVGIEEKLSLAGFNLMICQSNESLEKEKKALQTLMNARVDGIMMSLSMETRDYTHLVQLLNRGIKMVFFDRVPENLAVNAVVIDDHAAAFRITRELIRQEYRRPAHVGGSGNINVYRQRKSGYMEALKISGIPVTDSHIVETDMTREGGRQAFRNIMQKDPRPDAFVCAGDLAAHGVLLEALENNFLVPDEIAVSGFANEEFTQLITPPLTSVDQKGILIGREAAGLFLEQQSSNEGSRIVIDPEVLFRQSTMKERILKTQ